MTRPSELSRPLLLGAALLSTLHLKCVGTEESPVDSPPLCVDAEPSADPGSSVVLVRADLGDAGQIYCSGVVIAPTLVLTTMLCAGLPPDLDLADLGDSNLRQRGGFFRYFMGDVDYSDWCRTSDEKWAPAEDGSFSARISEWVDPSTLTVRTLPWGDDNVSSVNRVIRPPTDSRCWDTLAVLVLDRDLGRAPVTLRLEETSYPDDPVTMSGIFGQDDAFAHHELPSRIESVTFEAGDSDTPPRSMLLEGPICEYESGGPVVSDVTGSTIGVIGFETDYSCEDADAPTIATRVAPFRRMLLDAARDASEILRVEAPVDVRDPAWPTCPP
jgi:hypothetical protein